MKSDTSKSMLIISMGFLVLYLIFLWQWAIVVSLLVGIIGITSSYLSKKIEWFWMKVGDLLGLVVPKILLTLLFFLFLFPISILCRIFNKDTLMLSNKYNSYFIDVKKEFDKKSLEKTW
ncbi:MAG TPA: hypothetical protein VLN45_12910 [Ignavibacteriaceae bacterium]|nr:hypothetical protein [Ignavibacteriaceae bacterium]